MSYFRFPLVVMIFAIAWGIYLNIFHEGPIQSISIPSSSPPQPFEGTLQANDVLKQAEKLWEGQLVGPESLIFVDDWLIVSLQNGSIVKLNVKSHESVELTRFPPRDCHGQPLCIRPLGMQIAPSGEEIYVAEAYSGVYAVPLSGNEPMRRIFPPKDTKMPIVLINNVDVLPSGHLVVTESSRRFPLHRLALDLIEGRPTGRLYLVAPNSGHYHILAQNLSWANGVQMEWPGATVMPESFVSILVCETMGRRIVRVMLDMTTRTAHMEPWAENLPGSPDNLRRAVYSAAHSLKTRYWVAMPAVRHSGQWLDVIGVLGEWPKVRDFVAKVLPESWIMWLLHISPAGHYGLILGLDEAGHITESYHDPSGGVAGVSEVVEDPRDGSLYLGSYYRNYIAKVPKHLRSV